MNSPSASLPVIPLELVDSWPSDLLRYLGLHEGVFTDWYVNDRKDARAFDRAIYELRDLLRNFSIIGWHCTRLTDFEIAEICAGGLLLPDAALLHRRIDRLVADGVIKQDVAVALKTNNSAGNKSRAQMLWFCFFPPNRQAESGIGSFFRYWGGEALYVHHECNPITSAVLRTVGIPCIVEANVPIAALEPDGGLSIKVVRKFLVSRGHKTTESLDHEDRIKTPLPAANVLKIIRFPEPDFILLTQCGAWNPPL